jgi:hypothetical protein
MKLDHAQGWEYAVLCLSHDQDSWRMELFDNPRTKAPIGLPLETGRFQIETQDLRPARADGLAPGMIAVTDEGTWFVAKYWQEGELALVRISDGAIAPANDFRGLVSGQWSFRSERDGMVLLASDAPKEG